MVASSGGNLNYFSCLFSFRSLLIILCLHEAIHVSSWMPSIQILSSQKNLILNYKSTNLLSSNYVEKEEGTQSRGAYLTTRIVNWSKNSHNSNGVIVLDGDNIRGKTKFTISKEQLCDDVIKWSDSIGLSNRVILVFDHGSKHQAYYCNGIIIVFSGSRKSGDDIIARYIYFGYNQF